jgi:hypothetical protein
MESSDRPRTTGTPKGSFDGTVRRGGWPAGLIGMIVLVFGIETTVATQDVKVLNYISSQWRETDRTIPQAAGCDVLVLGDSLMKHGLISRVVEAQLGEGHRVYNLALPGGSAPSSYIMLRRVLEAGMKPSVLLVDGENFDDNPFRLDSGWPELLTPRELLELSWNANDPHFFAETALKEVLPSARHRYDLRSIVRKTLSGQVPNEARLLAAIRRNTRQNGGSFVFAHQYDLSKPDPRPGDLDRQNYQPGPFYCHTLNVSYAIRFLELAQSRGIEVVWLLPPNHPEVEIRRLRGGRIGGYLAFLGILQARFPNLTLASGLEGEYPQETLYDTVHLNKTGAIIFSDSVGRFVRRKLDHNEPSRNVFLGRYSEHAAEALMAFPAVEDLIGSIQAIEKAGIESRTMVAEGTKKSPNRVK